MHLFPPTVARVVAAMLFLATIWASMYAIHLLDVWDRQFPYGSTTENLASIFGIEVQPEPDCIRCRDIAKRLDGLLRRYPVPPPDKPLIERQNKVAMIVSKICQASASDNSCTQFVTQEKSLIAAALVRPPSARQVAAASNDAISLRSFLPSAEDAVGPMLCSKYCETGYLAGVFAAIFSVLRNPFARMVIATVGDMWGAVFVLTLVGVLLAMTLHVRVEISRLRYNAAQAAAAASGVAGGGRGAAGSVGGIGTSGGGGGGGGGGSGGGKDHHHGPTTNGTSSHSGSTHHRRAK